MRRRWPARRASGSASGSTTSWPPALTYAEGWIFPGGAFNNQAFYRPLTTISRPLADWQEVLLHDPQTSGGLLIAVPADRVASFRELCAERQQDAWDIGEVVEGDGVEIA
jgi:selenide,water dikinase